MISMLNRFTCTAPWSLAARILLVQELNENKQKKELCQHPCAFRSDKTEHAFHLPLSRDVKIHVLSSVVLHFKEWVMKLLANKVNCPQTAEHIVFVCGWLVSSALFQPFVHFVRTIVQYCEGKYSMAVFSSSSISKLAEVFNPQTKRMFRK